MRAARSIGVLSTVAFVMMSCGGGGGSTSPSPVVTPPPPTATRAYTVPAQESLSVGDVQQVLAQAINEARARNRPAAIAVTDRTGNVLALYAMTGADLSLKIPDAPGGASFNTELQGINLPAPAAVAGAIAKAVTGAYLSSGGNAFSTRTASQIVQQNFPPSPNAVGLEAGPLYGVQFSSLPCSDLNTRFGAAGLIGPKRSPLGLSADAGGFPLYKNGVLVGGVGVMGDGVYGFDPNILNTDNEDDEFSALAATVGFLPPVEIMADRILVDGTSLRYSDATPAGFKGGVAPAFTTLGGAAGALVNLPAYTNGTIIAGAAYGTEASGIRASTPSEFSNRDAFILSNGSGGNRYPARGGTDSAAVNQPLTGAETTAILEEAFAIMTRARAQIRRPLDSRAQVSISVVDTYGSVLGLVRSPDAPLFGIDVSLQKARTAAFFSNSRAGPELLLNPSADIIAMMRVAQTFFNDPGAFTGKNAFSNRTIGNITRPFFPDGEQARPPGPFSRGIAGFNPFSTGIQSALIVGNITQHVTSLLTGSADTPARCTASPDVVAGQNRIQNGIQIFPGSFPIYRGNVLIGAIGVSGDGIDQDDMIGFLGTNNAGTRLGGFGNAPIPTRADTIIIPLTNSPGVRLRYVGCPFAPFLDTPEQNVCQGR